MDIRKTRTVENVNNGIKHIFTNVTPYEAMQKMIYTLNLKSKCEPVINKSPSGFHLWFENKNGDVYAVAMDIK